MGARIKKERKKTRKSKIAASQPTFGRTPRKLIDELNSMKMEEL